MKLDIELCRKILFAIEDSIDDEPASIHLPVKEYDTLHIVHHTRLLKEANLIHAIEIGHSFEGTASLVPHSLTWQGCEFVRTVRNEKIWRKVKGFEALIDGELPLGLLYELALHELRQKIGLDVPVKQASNGNLPASSQVIHSDCA